MPDELVKVADAIPSPDLIREQLKKTLREAALLRRLLRVAQQAERDRQELAAGQAAGVRHAR